MKVIAFDLDGTLVDSVGDIAHALNLALVDVDRDPLDVDVVRSFVGNGARKLVERALLASAGRARAKDRALPLDDVLARFRAHYDAGLIERTVPFPGMTGVLSFVRAHGARVAVTTNKPSAPARAIVAALFPGLVDVVIGPEDAGGALKPDPAMLRAAGDVSALVGDSGVDLDTARNGGVPFIGVAWGLRPEELEGCEVAEDAAELARLLARWVPQPQP